MNIAEQIKKEIFSVQPKSFEKIALSLFQYQAKYNLIYQEYLQLLGVVPEKIRKSEHIPFLPIEFFKQHRIITANAYTDASPSSTIFESSGTTQQIKSKHYVSDINFYHSVAAQGFSLQYGNPENYHILALLPSYLERENASLVAMVQHFIQLSNSPYSGFFLHDFEKLITVLEKLKQRPGKTLLIGVSFALLDLAEQCSPHLKDVIVMETGGMKGRRNEIIREELHSILQHYFDIPAVHSEYGMTELLSQAYAPKGGRFNTPPWMRVFIRDMNDPFYLNNRLRSGGINIIDLANVDSCAFIETQDIGRYHTKEDTFEVLGRMDNSDIRGCNLMFAV
jgi:phenylacetate-coenzyme A ligase PaaK-like adenylate-forming protein